MLLLTKSLGQLSGKWFSAIDALVLFWEWQLQYIIYTNVSCLFPYKDCLFNLFSSFQVTTGNRTKYYVSYRRNEFVQMRFPKYALPKVTQQSSYLIYC